MGLPINNAISKSIYNSIYRERYSFKRYTDQLATGYDILISRTLSIEQPAKEAYFKLGDMEAERLAREHKEESIKDEKNCCEDNAKTP